jgi:hypothetical protein
LGQKGYNLGAPGAYEVVSRRQVTSGPERDTLAVPSCPPFGFHAPLDFPTAHFCSELNRTPTPTYAHIQTHTHTHTHARACTHTYKHTHTHTHAKTHTHTYNDTHTYKHTHTHTRTHTRMRRRSTCACVFTNMHLLIDQRSPACERVGVRKRVYHGPQERARAGLVGPDVGTDQEVRAFTVDTRGLGVIHHALRHHV